MTAHAATSPTANNQLHVERQCLDGYHLSIPTTNHKEVSMQTILSSDNVLELIAPVDPDTLQHVGQLTYEARWLPPVPPEELEALREVEGITVSGEPFHPKGLPKGCRAVRFTVN